MLSAYTDSPFGKLFKAHRWYRKYLSRMFVNVPSPFILAYPRNTQVSLAQIAMIKELRANGMKIKDIVKEVGVCFQTLQRYLKK